MSLPASDIVITGAGPVGCAMALQLAAHAPDPARIVLRGVFDEPAADAGPAVRTLALNQGSCAMLEVMGRQADKHKGAAAGPPLGDVLVDGADIHVVHVSQKGRLGRTLIEREALQVPRLGCVVAYPDLVAFLRAAARRSGVTVQAMDNADMDNAGDASDTLQDDGHALHIISDGMRPRHLNRDYGQHGVLAVVQAGRPRAHWAFERFTREGPLALLPHPAGENMYSLVWCCPPDQARARREADPAAFDAELQTQFGDRLGRLHLASARLVAPLSLNMGPQWTSGRRVVIGNAAQTLHPVAGQGLNLALRDVAQLAQSLRPWLHRPHTDPAPDLAGYRQARQADRWLTAGITDLLPRVFTTGNPLVEHACGLGLLGMDMASGLRTPLSRHLLQGLRG